MIRVVLLFVALVFAGCSYGPPPRTVEQVDLNRYAGVWWEIAAIPQIFQLGCEGTSATYTPMPDGSIRVVNVCHEGSPTGPTRSAVGRARSVNPPANTQLKVSFGGPVEGDYWIFRLDDEYTTAAVGSPDRNSLWILHRTPHMDEEEYQSLIDSLRADGFPVDRLKKTEH